MNERNPKGGSVSDVPFQIEPIPGEEYEGRVWGWRISRPGVEFRATTGGTGPCWNIGESPAAYVDPNDAGDIHVCDLDDLIEALQALRASDAYRLNEERWA